MPFTSDGAYVFERLVRRDVLWEDAFGRGAIDVFYRAGLPRALHGMQDAKADAVAPEGRARLTVHFEGDSPIGVARDRAGPAKVDVALHVFDFVADAERVGFDIHRSVAELRRYRLPVVVAHGDIYPA